VSELVSAFVRALQPDYVIETGTCIGQTSYVIGLALRANGHGRCDTLEVKDELVAVARDRCGGLPVTVHQVASLDFVPAEMIGFAWFDSLRELRVREFLAYRPFMQPGTIVGFHDTAPHFGAFGVAVENLTGLRAINLPTPRGVTFAEVM
jgi:predicted O-methyltransferase YrrM